MIFWKDYITFFRISTAPQNSLSANSDRIRVPLLYPKILVHNCAICQQVSTLGFLKMEFLAEYLKALAPIYQYNCVHWIAHQTCVAIWEGCLTHWYIHSGGKFPMLFSKYTISQQLWLNIAYFTTQFYPAIHYISWALQLLITLIVHIILCNK